MNFFNYEKLFLNYIIKLYFYFIVFYQLFYNIFFFKKKKNQNE